MAETPHPARDVNANGHLSRPPTQTTSVFLSYSREDREQVARIGQWLSEQDGITVYRDIDDVLPTEEWRKRLGDLIISSDAVIFCLSPRSAQSAVCQWEIELANDLKKRIAPIVVADVKGQVPQAIAKLNYIFATERDDFSGAMSSLLSSLQSDIAWIREHTRIGGLAVRWKANNRANDQLLRGRELDLAEQWVALRPTNAPQITTTTLDFIQTSRLAQIASAKTVRLIRLLLSCLVIFIAIGAIGWHQQDAIYEFYHWQAKMQPTTPLLRDEAAFSAGTEFADCKTGCPRLRIVPPGQFMMGSPESDRQGEHWERPQRKVVIVKPLAIGKRPITYNEWDHCSQLNRCRALSDNGWGRGNRPVVNVSWDDAQVYLKWLSRKTGRIYRLLSESEYEYMARAGSDTRYFWGDDVIAGYANCYGCDPSFDGRLTSIAGLLKPNAFGLHDVHGNVWQWVEDCWRADFTGAPNTGAAIRSECSVLAGGTVEDARNRRVVRGGSFREYPTFVRAAVRSSHDLHFRSDNVGFRVVRELVDSSGN